MRCSAYNPSTCRSRGKEDLSEGGADPLRPPGCSGTGCTGDSPRRSRRPLGGEGREKKRGFFPLKLQRDAFDTRDSRSASRAFSTHLAGCRDSRSFPAFIGKQGREAAPQRGLVGAAGLGWAGLFLFFFAELVDKCIGSRICIVMKSDKKLLERF